jgi:hypothetical protein
MRFFKILVFGLILSEVQQVRAATVEINANFDGDIYLSGNIDNNSRFYMNVGQYSNGSLRYHVGLANWNSVDLPPLVGQTSVTLTLYVQNFVVPVFSNGMSAQPVLTPFPTGDFDLKVVALSGDPTSYITGPWVNTNMIDAVEVGSVHLTKSGYATVDIGNRLANWIADSNGLRWLGFVGKTSTTSPYTSVQLGTLEPAYVDASAEVVLSKAAPMYLSVETSPPAPVVRSCSISENNLVMIFETVPNTSYTLKTKSNLSDPAWVTVESSFLAGPTSTTTLTVPMTDSPRQGFYRLEITP